MEAVQQVVEGLLSNEWRDVCDGFGSFVGPFSKIVALYAGPPRANQILVWQLCNSDSYRWTVPRDIEKLVAYSVTLGSNVAKQLYVFKKEKSTLSHSNIGLISSNMNGEYVFKREKSTLSHSNFGLISSNYEWRKPHYYEPYISVNAITPDKNSRECLWLTGGDVVHFHWDNAQTGDTISLALAFL
jgi:hypothetical protein